MGSKRIPTAFFLALCLAPLRAQEPGGALPSLKDLLATPVTVASRKAEGTRESPGVVTVLTRDEILASGARDLLDLLRLVPGFDAAADVQGQVGVSVRGLWAYEGKLLLLWDGLELNELLYGETQLGGRYPVDQIKRVEIIRGPGSVLHGDAAEIAVVKVTSLGAEDLPAVGGAFAYGQGTGGRLRRTFQAVAATRGEGWSLRVGTLGGETERGEGALTDALGQSYEMHGQSRIRPNFTHLGLEVGDLQLAAVVDQVRMDQRDNFGENLPAASPIAFRSTNLQARYTWAPRPNLVLTPSLTYQDHKPWWTSADLPEGFTQFSTERRKAALDVVWDPRGDLTLAAGFMTREDHSRSRSDRNPFTFLEGRTELTYSAWAAYAEVQTHGDLNLTLGGRYEHHSDAGGAFAPRFALTGVRGPWHLKVLAARSFHAPSVQDQNQRFDPTLRVVPETSRTLEVEVGRTLGAGLLSVNAFDLRLEDPIIFVSDASNGGNGGYRNQGRLASRGLEAQYQLRGERGFLNASLALHRAREGGDYYGVPGSPRRFLGVADRSFSILGGVRLGGGWALGTTFLWLSDRQGWAWDAGAGGLALQRFPARTLLGATATRTRGPWAFSLGVQDALDEAPPTLQAYAGGHGPLPGTGREWVVKLRHGF